MEAATLAGKKSRRREEEGVPPSNSKRTKITDCDDPDGGPDDEYFTGDDDEQDDKTLRKLANHRQTSWTIGLAKEDAEDLVSSLKNDRMTTKAIELGLMGKDDKTDTTVTPLLKTPADWVAEGRKKYIATFRSTTLSTKDKESAIKELNKTFPLRCKDYHQGMLSHVLLFAPALIGIVEELSDEKD